jgi:hypothetical protein
LKHLTANVGYFFRQMQEKLITIRKHPHDEPLLSVTYNQRHGRLHPRKERKLVLHPAFDTVRQTICAPRTKIFCE